MIVTLPRGVGNSEPHMSYVTKTQCGEGVVGCQWGPSTGWSAAWQVFIEPAQEAVAVTKGLLDIHLLPSMPNPTGDWAVLFLSC